MAKSSAWSKRRETRGGRMPADLLARLAPASSPSYGTHEVLTLSTALALADQMAGDPMVSLTARSQFREIARLIRKACE